MKIQFKKYTFLIIILVGLNTTASFSQKAGEVHVQTSPQIKNVIAKKIAYNKALKPVKKYKIQLFYGSEQGAKRVSNEFNATFSDLRAVLKFNSPDWKVLVGAFKTRLEADRALVDIKKEFPDATVRNPKIKR